MRTTIRIDDDLLRELKEQARREKLSLNRFLNQTLRKGLQSPAAGRKRPADLKPARMGKPLFNLDKALALAAALEDEQIIAKLAAGK